MGYLLQNGQQGGIADPLRRCCSKNGAGVRRRLRAVAAAGGKISAQCAVRRCALRRESCTRRLIVCGA